MGLMSCREVVSLVTEYLDKATSPEDRARFEEHVAICPPCRAHLAQMRRTIDAARQVSHPPDTPRSAAGDAEILDVFRRWRDGTGDE